MWLKVWREIGPGMSLLPLPPTFPRPPHFGPSYLLLHPHLTLQKWVGGLPHTFGSVVGPVAAQESQPWHVLLKAHKEGNFEENQRGIRPCRALGDCQGHHTWSQVQTRASPGSSAQGLFKAPRMTSRDPVLREIGPSKSKAVQSKKPCCGPPLPPHISSPTE